MKRFLMFLIILHGVFLLSACQKSPYNAPPGTTMVSDDTIEFVYDNNQSQTTLFSHTFAKEYIFFTGPNNITYNFKNINNYRDLSADFITFLNQFDIVHYDRFENTTLSDDNTIRMSIGATESDYNLVDVVVDDTLTDVDAYITTESGLQIIFSYTEFMQNNTRIIIPYTLVFLTHDIHKSIIKQYLGNNNIYSDEPAVVVTYETLLVPFPPKTIVKELFDNTNLIKQIDYFNRVLKDDTASNPKTISACTNELLSSCFSPEYSHLEATVYDMTLQEVRSFYEMNYLTQTENETVIITHNENKFQLEFNERIIANDGEDIPVIEVEVIYYTE